jgi:hypothetical protein
MVQNPIQSALKEAEESSHNEITILRETNEQLKEKTNENGTSGRIYMQRFLVVVVLIISSVCIDLIVAYSFMDLGENNTIHIDLDVMDSATANYQRQSQDNNMGAIHIEGNFNVNFNPLLSEPHVNSVFCDIMYKNEQAFSVFVDVSQKRQQTHIHGNLDVGIKDIDYELMRSMMLNVGNKYRRNDVILHALCSIEGALKLFSADYLYLPVVLHETKFHIPFGTMVQYILGEIFKVGSSTSNNSTNDDADIDDPRAPADFLDSLAQPWLRNFPVPKVDTFNYRESKFGWDIPLLETIRTFLNSKLGISSLKLSLPTIDYSLKFEGANFTEHDMETIKIGIQKAYNVSSKISAKSKMIFPQFPFLNMSSMENWTIPDLDVILKDLSEIHGLVIVNSTSNVAGLIDFAKDSVLSIKFLFKCPSESSVSCNLFTPALMPTLGKHPEVEIHTDHVNFVTSFFGPYHYVSKTTEKPSNSSSSAALAMASEVYYASRRLDNEGNDCSVYDVDGVVSISSCESTLTVYDDGGDIITMDFWHESTRVFSHHVQNVDNDPNIIILDVYLDHPHGLFNGNLSSENYKIGVNSMGIDFRIMGNASVSVYDNSLEINNMWGKEADIFFQDPYLVDTYDVYNVGHQVYWFQSSTRWIDFENSDIDSSSTIYYGYSYCQDFKFAENDINEPIFMMNHSLNAMGNDDDGTPWKLEYKYQIPQYDVIIGFSSDTMYPTVSNFSYDADLYFAVGSTEYFRVSPKIDYDDHKDVSDFHNGLLNFNLVLTTNEIETIFSMNSRTTMKYKYLSNYFDIVGLLHLYDGSGEEIFRIHPTFLLMDHGKVGSNHDPNNEIISRNTIQIYMSGENVMNFEAGCVILRPPGVFGFNGNMHMEADSQEIFRISPTLRVVDFGESSGAETKTFDMTATLPVVVDDNEIVSIHVNSSIYDPFLHLEISTSLSIKSDEVFRLSPSIRIAAANANGDDPVDSSMQDFNMIVPLHLFGEIKPRVNLWTQARVRYWHHELYPYNPNYISYSDVYHQEATLYQIKTGHMMLTLPETHPDWNMKIFDVVDLAMKNVEKYNFVYNSGIVEEYHYTYMGASWSDFMETLEMSGSTLYTGNDDVSAMEMDMKIHTVDMSMSMLMDFENSYIAMNMQADESADWDMSGSLAMQVKPAPAFLSELATDVSEGMINYVEADMSMDGSAVVDPYEYGELRSVEPFNRQATLGAPLDFSWINTTLTSMNVEFQARDCPVNPRPQHSAFMDIFDFRAADISVARNEDDSYVINIEGFRKYFGQKNVSLKAVFTNRDRKQRSYGRLSNLNTDTAPFMFTQVISSDPVEFMVNHIRLKLCDASKPKGSKRVLSCIDLVM